jgi:hypothetical protein
MIRRFAFLAALGLVAAAAPALAQQRQPAQRPLSPTEQLNQLSLERARAGQNSPTPGPDTTANLNAISERAAASGQNMNQAPMPFR